MSYTVAQDAYEQLENRLNVVIRHCKIGKVTRKAPPKYFGVQSINPDPYGLQRHRPMDSGNWVDW